MGVAMLPLDDDDDGDDGAADGVLQEADYRFCVVLMMPCGLGVVQIEQLYVGECFARDP